MLLYIAMGVLLSQPRSAKASTGVTGELQRGGEDIVCVGFDRPLLHTSAGEAADDCTSGFISLDRMHAVLKNYGGVIDLDGAQQAIIPGINFTCSGSIEGWTFGANWEEDTDFIELHVQIWRQDSEDGSYTKVGNTTINVEEEGQTLSSLLSPALSSRRYSGIL